MKITTMIRQLSDVPKLTVMRQFLPVRVYSMSFESNFHVSLIYFFGISFHMDTSNFETWNNVYKQHVVLHLSWSIEHFAQTNRCPKLYHRLQNPSCTSKRKKFLYTYKNWNVPEILMLKFFNRFSVVHFWFYSFQYSFQILICGSACLRLEIWLYW